MSTDTPTRYETECGFCDKDGKFVIRGKRQPCPYCGGTTKMRTIDLEAPGG